MRNTSFINSLIKKENEVIKGYQGIIAKVSDESLINSTRECIERHNNHIEALKGMQGR